MFSPTSMINGYLDHLLLSIVICLFGKALHFKLACSIVKYS